MSQPHDATEALPTRRMPAAGDPTVRLDAHPAASPPDEPTVHLRSDRATGHGTPEEATIHLTADQATTRLVVPSGPDDAATARLAVPPGPDEEATTRLVVPSGPDDAATARLAVPRGPDEEATTRLAVPPGPDDTATARLAPADEATTRLAASTADEATTRLVGTGPSGAGEATVHLPADVGATYPAATGHLDATVHTGPGRSTAHRPGEPTGVNRTGTYGRPTSAASTGTGAARVGASGRTGSGVAAQAGGEVRFGPGVPTTPPPAPAWPVSPPPRRRPVWRRLTSLLSGLLTVVLVVVVGLYLWQRLRPLEVDGVTVATPPPAGCDATVDVVATVATNGRAGEIRYQWLRSGSTPGTLLTERVGWGQRSVTLTLRWAFSGVGAASETATVNIVSPSAMQAQTPVRYDCRG
ncbi:hypothetical protein [Micromonospora endolithica]|uniref:Uncharacterized protein n=1 Tax=Micromonospora endolithica TaxID=230091 RepID=A0A3A9YWP9_9ACTN|nr:hypothetical protein [Micromonospora endolithica]RKN39657.1 hypothetical protein D7223_28605 [Micromonospora endolithica]TWJ22199.1 hypothetical protein JD76_02313 [Micromonospora endolithica]